MNDKDRIIRRENIRMDRANTPVIGSSALVDDAYRQRASQLGGAVSRHSLHELARALVNARRGRWESLEGLSDSALRAKLVS